MIGRWIAAGLVAPLLLASTVAAAPGEGDPPPPTIEPPPPAAVVEVDPTHYRMVLAGDIVIGLGGAGLITMAVGLVIRSDAVSQRRALGAAIEPDLVAIARQERRIETGTILAITGGAAAGALFATGITLVALGYSRERKRREALSLIPSPIFGDSHVGLAWQLRFR